MPVVEYDFISLAQIGWYRGLCPIPDRLGGGPGQTATTRRQSLWLPRAPWELERPSPLATSSEALPSLSQDLFEGIVALHESIFESLDVTFARKNHRLGVPDQAEDSRFYPSLIRNKYFGTSLSVWSIANLKVAASYRTIDYGEFSAVWQIVQITSP